MKKLDIAKIAASKGFKLLNCVALLLVIHSANVTCGWIYHQPEEPLEVKQFRKF